MKKRIFERFRLPGFVSLIRSSNLLKKFMERVGLIKGEQLELEVNQDDLDETGENIVTIKLGNTQQIFNPHNEHYLIGSVGDNETITLCYLEVYNHNVHKGKRSTKNLKKNKGVWFDLTSSEYSLKKGPPLPN